MGGLGNQLFQYAAGKSLSIFHDTELKLDLGWFDRYNERLYELNNFNIDASIASPHEANRYTGMYKSKINRIFWRIKQKLFYLSIYNELQFHFDENFFNTPKNVYIQGYWQSQKYFADIDNLIRDNFLFITPQTGQNIEVAKLITSLNSVSLHVRRGDYISSPGIKNLYESLDMSYYSQCIDEMTAKIKNPHFFIFSDDPDWVQENFKIKYKHTIIKHNEHNMSFEDLRLMALCKHHIIANSTFSWWGAWLSRNSGKIVCAPRQWFGIERQVARDMRDLIPSTWIVN